MFHYSTVMFYLADKSIYYIQMALAEETTSEPTVRHQEDNEVVGRWPTAGASSSSQSLPPNRAQRDEINALV